MIVDSSALVAILKDEPGADALKQRLAEATTVQISAGTLLETAVVVDGRRDPVLGYLLDDLLVSAEVVVVPVTEAQARIGRQAYRDFGRGSGHPARLNLGDCFTYALARATGEPLLFVGDGFGHTDVQPA